MSYAHDMCHQGYKRTKEKLRLNFFLARNVQIHQGIRRYMFSLSEKGESCYKRQYQLVLCHVTKYRFHAYIWTLLDLCWTRLSIIFVCV